MNNSPDKEIEKGDEERERERVCVCVCALLSECERVCVCGGVSE